MMSERLGVSIDCNPGQHQDIASSLSHVLTSKELEETQTLFIRGNIRPRIEDFGDITPLKRFLALNQSNWLIDLLADRRFVSYFQPIVSMQNTQEIFGYESLLRGLDKNGDTISPKLILDAALEAGLLPQADQLARLTAIANFSGSFAQPHQKLFINFLPTALYDPFFCLGATVDAIDRANISHDQIVFEVTEAGDFKNISDLKRILDSYRESGFLVALDDVGEGYSGLNRLHQLRPDFIKLDMALIRNVHRDFYKGTIVEKILEIAHNLDIKTVAEGIECTEELAWLQERGATFGQGYLIAKPSPTLNQETPYFPAPVLLKIQNQENIYHQEDQLEAIISTITQRICRSLELKEVLMMTVAEVREIFEVDRVLIYQFRPDWTGFISAESVATECFPLTNIEGIENHFQSSTFTLTRNWQVRIISDIDAAELSPYHHQILQEWDIRASILVPIIQASGLWGLLIAHQCHQPRIWKDLEIKLFKRLSTQLATIIQQSELFCRLQTS